jgi:hypothetical protein
MIHLHMPNKQTLLFAALLVSGLAFGQTKREILVEDPKESPNLRLELTPLNMYVSGANSFAGWSLKGAYRWKNKLSLSVDYRKEFFDFENTDLENENDGGFDYGQPYKGSAYEVMGTYFFKTREKEVEENLALKSKQVSYNTVEVTVDEVPLTRLALYGVRLGYGGSKGTTPLQAATLTEVGTSNKTEDNFSIPLQTTKTLFTGLSATRIRNLKVKYPKYGVRRRQHIKEYYADALFAVSNSFSPVTGLTYDDNGNPRVRNYNVANTNGFGKLGVRAGIFSSSTAKWVNFGYGMEVGAFPGGESLSRSFYFNFRFAFSLFKNVGPAITE